MLGWDAISLPRSRQVNIGIAGSLPVPGLYLSPTPFPERPSSLARNASPERRSGAQDFSRAALGLLRLRHSAPEPPSSPAEIRRLKSISPTLVPTSPKAGPRGEYFLNADFYILSLFHSCIVISLPTLFLLHLVLPSSSITFCPRSCRSMSTRNAFSIGEPSCPQNWRAAMQVSAHRVSTARSIPRSI
ncbi:hypothetical protein DFH06DRAFT_111703 [Mycena polygramma]|nr:hypothetical protein DFH06DRAFT_111703 [Mycena polygramma]